MQFRLVALCALLYTSNEELLCDGIEMLYAGGSGASTKIPAGVCITDGLQSSHKLECKCNAEDDIDIYKFSYNNTHCNGTSISNTSYSGSHFTHPDIIGFNIVCHGNPCNYGIKRTTHTTTNCSHSVPIANVSTITDDIFIIGSCDATFASSIKTESCENEYKLNRLAYENTTDCSGNGQSIADPTSIDGSCDTNGSRYSISCGVAETQSVTALKCGEKFVMHPSLYGSWIKHHHHHTFEFHIAIHAHCTQIMFKLVSPVNDTWFAVGLGGDYLHTTGSQMMNGYGIVQLLSTLDSVYETVLEPGEAPIPQNPPINQNIECTNTEEHGTRTSICTRPYKTEDDDYGDFFKFIYGDNTFIWAFGDIADRIGIPLKHDSAYVDQIHLHGDVDSLCGYAKDRMDESEDVEATQEGETETTMVTGPMDYVGSGVMIVEGGEEWKIIAIVFIILCGVITPVLLYFVISRERRDSGQRYQRTNTGDTQDVKVKHKGEIMAVPQQSDVD